MTNVRRPDARLPARLCVSGEGFLPCRQVGGGDFYVQGGHERIVSLRHGFRPSQVPGVSGRPSVSSMAVDAATRRAVDRLERLCRGYDEERPMRIALVEELRRSVAFNAYVWGLTDPSSEVAMSPLADVPDA